MELIKILNDAGLLREVLYLGGCIIIAIIIKGISIKIGDKIISIGKSKDEKKD